MATKAEKARRAAIAAAILFGDDQSNAAAQVPVNREEPDGGPLLLPPARTPDAAASVGIRASRGDVRTGPSFDIPSVPKLMYPKNHAEGSLTPGLPVYYKGQRYYVEYAPVAWARGCSVRISSQRLRMPEGSYIEHAPVTKIISVTHRGEEQVGRNRESFFVHADLLTLAPVLNTVAELTGKTSKASVDRTAMRKAGRHDIGDEVAKLLREAGGLDGVYRVAAKYLVEREETLRKKYGHLNPGQQRMNLGNRMRAQWRKNHK